MVSRCRVIFGLMALEIIELRRFGAYGRVGLLSLQGLRLEGFKGSWGLAGFGLRV